MGVRPDFPGLNDLLSAPQNKLGCERLLINLVYGSVSSLHKGSRMFAILLLVLLCLVSLLKVFRQQEPRLVDVRSAAETGLTLVSFKSGMWL